MKMPVNDKRSQTMPQIIRGLYDKFSAEEIATLCHCHINVVQNALLEHPLYQNDRVRYNLWLSQGCDMKKTARTVNKSLSEIRRSVNRISMLQAQKKRGANK